MPDVLPKDWTSLEHSRIAANLLSEGLVFAGHTYLYVDCNSQSYENCSQYISNLYGRAGYDLLLIYHKLEETTDIYKPGKCLETGSSTWQGYGYNSAGNYGMLNYNYSTCLRRASPAVDQTIPIIKLYGQVWARQNADGLLPSRQKHDEILVRQSSLNDLRIAVEIGNQPAARQLIAQLEDGSRYPLSYFNDTPNLLVVSHLMDKQPGWTDLIDPFVIQ